MELLKINFFNDQLKSKLARHLANHSASFSDDQIKAAMRFFGPTFIRLFPSDMALLIQSLNQNKQPLPIDWLKRIPYDNIIRISKILATSKENEGDIFVLVSSYQRAHQSNKKLSQQLEALLKQMEKITSNRLRASGE
jgi:hypothetical protein